MDLTTNLHPHKARCPPLLQVEESFAGYQSGKGHRERQELPQLAYRRLALHHRRLSAHQEAQIPSPLSAG